VDVLAKANMLGHADPSITLKRYAGLFDKGNDRLGEAMSAVCCGPLVRKM
jgi:hypothetical protein